MKVIGITGGTGAGKTTVLKVLQTHGAAVLDCDRIYHELTLSSPQLRRELTDTFGDVYLADGTLDREKLGKIVFGDRDKLQQLNALTYYYLGLEIRRRLVELKESGAALAAIDAVNLIASGLGELCGMTVAVTAPEEIRLARIMERDGIGRERALARIRAQQPEEYYRRHCHAVLCNDGTPEELTRQAEILFNNFMLT